MAARLAVAAAIAMAVVLLGVAAADVGSIISQDTFNTMLPNRDNTICPANGFYTYDAFIQAADFFQGFGTSGGDDDANKRELAAFFGQTSHETNGGAAGDYTWGYCYKEEITPTSPPFQGRGPIQLTGQSNYQAAGDAIGEDLVNNPDLVAADPVISFKTAIWFWMTAQSPKPSCHDVILGNWTPSSDDNAAGRVPGYGVITNIINGGIECGMGQNAANVNRIGYYQTYCSIFGVDPGSNLDCYNQQHF